MIEFCPEHQSMTLTFVNTGNNTLDKYFDGGFSSLLLSFTP